MSDALAKKAAIKNLLKRYRKDRAKPYLSVSEEGVEAPGPLGGTNMRDTAMAGRGGYEDEEDDDQIG